MLDDNKIPFTELSILDAPPTGGGYVLWDGKYVILVGYAEGAETIQSCLRSHHRGDYGPCTKGANLGDSGFFSIHTPKEEGRTWVKDVVDWWTLHHKVPPRCQDESGQRR